MAPSPNTATGPSSSSSSTGSVLTTKLEHVNITVADPDATANMLVDLFGWTIRWKGPSLLGGHTVHVGQPGTGDNYLAVYTTPSPPENASSRSALGHLNHLGLVVDDLEEAERRITQAGFETYNHGDYEPGRRFYFDDHDGIEFEVISYDNK